MTPRSEDFILGAMGGPVRIGGRATTSPEELELWEEPGEWPREGPEQSNTTDGGAVRSIRLQDELFLFVQDASEWEFGIDSIWACGFRGPESIFLSSG